MASDDVSYFIPSIPDEVVKCVQLLRKISTAEFSAVLGVTRILTSYTHLRLAVYIEVHSR